MSSIRREWLDWSNPCIPTAAAWLIQNPETPKCRNAETRDVCDLREVVCVLPGRRAGRLLLSHLIQECRSRRLQLVPPVVLTPGAMIDAILNIDVPIASEAESIMGWVGAIEKSDPADLEPLLPRLTAGDARKPASVGADLWSLGRLLANLHAELAGQRLKFGDVADQAERLEMLSEGSRWRALETLHGRYFRILSESKLSDPHQAREKSLAAFEANGQERAANIVLIGVVELNALQRALIQLNSASAVALVHAPARLSEQFDSLGCVIPAKWSEHQIDLGDEQLHIADRPGDQAQSALRAMARLGGSLSTAQITIGMGDPSIAPAMQHAADWAGLSVRTADGSPLRASPPCMALDAIANYLEDPRFANLAALLRHVNVEEWLAMRTAGAPGTSEWLTLLDRYFAEYLHERLTEPWLGNDQTRLRLATVHRAVQELVAPLALESKPLASPGRWAQPILDVLAKLHGSEHAARAHADACRQIRDALAEFAAAPLTLQPQLGAAEMIRLLLEHIADVPVPEDLEDHQIEMLGWLELHLDPAPALIITGFNEGHIPQSATADAFLPDTLRRKLGLTCNDTRYARDAYLLEAIRHSRRHLMIIAGRRTSRGEPLTPSRLLLACDSETLVRRVASMCDGRAPSLHHDPIGVGAKAGAESRFIVPALPEPVPARESMTITEFKEYLACPYRYALKRLLKLKSLDDSMIELDPMQFGTLAHDVLCSFGRDDEINACEDIKKIERYLSNALAATMLSRFGRSPMPAVRVQAARLEQRLRSYARRQAEMCAAGWRIRHCELPFKGEIALDVPGQESMPLRGKIDRIDFNERTGAWRIIDYKTGDSGKSPFAAHHGSQSIPSTGTLEWLDLQLPLYHFLATRSTHNISGDVRLAYICLPRQSDGATINEAEWTTAHLDHALETARGIVRRIRAGEFKINPAFGRRFDEFARICQTVAFTERELAEIGVEEVAT